MQPLEGHLVVDFTRQLPGPYASRELLRLGARVVKIEPPDGDSMQLGAPSWYDAINAGKEIVRLDLKEAAGLAEAQALCDEADVILDGFRPGVFERLGLQCPEPAPSSARSPASGRRGGTRCGPGTTSTTSGGRGCSPTPRPAVPPTQVADLAAGALGALVEILAALARAGADELRDADHDLDDPRRA